MTTARKTGKRPKRSSQKSARVRRKAGVVTPRGQRNTATTASNADRRQRGGAAPAAVSCKAPSPPRYTALAIDRAFKANLARLTAGISPAGVADVYFNWLAHLALSPGKQWELMERGGENFVRFAQHAAQAIADPETPPCIEPLPQDRRFSSEEWRRLPYSLIYQAFLLTQQFWHNATTDIDGLSDEDEHAVSFIARQVLDRYAPSNFIWTNPEVLTATTEEEGGNLIRGAQNLLDDCRRMIERRKPAGTENFTVGRDVAVTPGKIVYRNRLIELIQYAPTTDRVCCEPIVIVPAWIMKYYILDLSPQNSLVRYLRDQGHTVFMISWRNPTAEDRDLGMADYLRLGMMDALDAVCAIVPNSKVHAVGYCLGGTLLSIATAAMQRDGDHRLASMTTFAAQVDFTEAGELLLFIRDSEVSYLENMMWDQGFLDGAQMGGAFQLLRSNDLIWSRNVREYLLGQRQGMNDLMAWNADVTRLPYRMHSEYLRGLFLNNDLAAGRFIVGDRPVNLSDIRVPIFAVATIRDHVAPWRSVHKVTFESGTDVTFLLTTGGHNAGIVSEPGHPRRSYQVATKLAGEPYVDPDTWLATAPRRDGSWWSEWLDWLEARSTPDAAPPIMGAPDAGLPPLEDAPGTYVLQQ